MTSPGSSTTQISPASRRSSWQIRQRGSSARLKQISQKPMRSLTSRIASARALASSASARRRWNARRWAVRWPTPGSLPSSVIRRWTGGAYKLSLEARQAQVAEPAGEPAHLRRGKLLRRAQRLVGGGEHHVLQQLGILGIDGVRVDGDRLHHEVAGHLDLHHPAAGRGLDLLVLELLLRGHHVLLHLLDLLEHLLHVRLGHQAPPSFSSGSGRISSASNSATNRATISSSEGGSASSGSSCSARSSSVRRSPGPASERTD